ncbi:helix-turn-helix domain-containing protein [Solwaraspora sp. WMMD1047]|uniref:winged helix-turn-helix transcriptional regulator n=1 Tax=Solwaraspora sp. WMMD1047 TaxID=3016102 RepID=UPI002416557D|nr:helix-turn-helix domain-containing protein [Solwaraspora sp. WMMD1047]MDG4833663.1 helix-turn-helix domain-containing protein [Solwaraspora sp. WMMD1047]
MSSATDVDFEHAAGNHAAAVGPTAANGPAGASDPSDELVSDVFARACPSRRTLENVAGKWGILALVALAEGTYRFNALRRRVDGVSEKMLSQTLHALERDGLVSRAVQATIPPHVEYSLTPAGLRVATKLRELIDLVEAEMPTILTAQTNYDANR